MKFCSLYSGSSGNCQFIKTDSTKILVDAGLSGKKIQQALTNIGEEASDIQGIFITHEHIDHIQGAGILSRRFNIPVFANEETWNAMKPSVGQIKPENIRVIDDSVEIGDLFVQAFDISHDAAKPVGYKIFNDNKKICLLTDTGCVTPSIKQNVMGSDLILIETNHDEDMVLIGSYPWPLKRRVLGEFGHMSNDLAGNLLCEILKKGTEIVLLAHLSKENNFPELAFKTVENILGENGISTNEGITINMTYRDKSTKVYDL
ncbi:MBL fold metallo-hydrolase [Sedimentibacter sp. zth1]|uniref:MBL fold metallo-hydrolase n=1 Tax=Sedimentibacter sp. zth1 TaxID=2816908 RepID=UPI001A9342D6|nr:MBL fold metallo-hydrolase [Sedimentibacter sp. zth1]QSX05012.1 MBL fold metallo-hydrolase [Sedimentibacter sp. zth1]